MATVRYFAKNLDDAVAFYTRHLGFTLQQQFGPNMAILVRGDLSLWLAGPGASASKPMPDGRRPEPGGWNRIVIAVEDLPALVQSLRGQGVLFRNEILSGPGGQQILCEDPSGNAIELFQAG
jgi:catechol 2,3-dioxygenase-like lactoylglutathione lyase family enzyme